MKQNLLAWLTLLFSLTFALAPFITSPFQGFSETQLPVPQIDPPLQPAGYAFSIWGLVYLWLIVSAGYGVWQRPQAPLWQKMRPALIVSLVVGTFWLWIANTSPIWATVTIFIMLITALLALLAAGKEEWIWLRGPLGLYAGWLSAAAFVSLGSVTAGYGLIGSVSAAWVGIILALCLILLVLWQTGGTLAYAAAAIWALVGIVVNNGFTHITVSVLAIVGIVLIGLVTWQAHQKPKLA